MADLTTFIPVRHRPAGPVETFSTERAAETVAVEIRHRGRRDDPPALRGRGARAASPCRQLSAGRKNSLQYEIDGSSSAVAWDSEQPEQLWIGHRDRPNELLLRNPALMNELGGARGAPARAATWRASPTPSAPCSWRSTTTSSPGGPPTAPRYPTFADGHDEMLVGDADRRERPDRRLGRRRARGRREPAGSPR